VENAAISPSLSFTFWEVGFIFLKLRKMIFPLIKQCLFSNTNQKQTNKQTKKTEDYNQRAQNIVGLAQ